MVIKHISDVPVKVMEGMEGVTKQILIGKDDGSHEVVMRRFCLDPAGTTPYHSHDFPHLVIVKAGKGVVIDAEGKEHPLQNGKLVYMPDNEVHGFRNTSDEPFVFLCIVPGRGEK